MPGRGRFIAANLDLLISILVQIPTAMRFLSTAVCFLLITAMRVLLTGFYIVATAVRITIARLITALDVVATAASTTKSIASMTILSSISFVLRYAASLDYPATIAACLGIAVVPRIRNIAAIVVLSCIIDILDFTIGLGNSISLAAFAIASVISNTILRAMKLFTLKRIYQVLGVLGLVILYIYLSLVAIFLYHGIYHGSPIAYQILTSGNTIAYQNITSMSATTVFVVSLWIQIIPIYALCRHLLPGYVTGMVPIACLALPQADYIYIPSYPWLWAILIVFQAWCVAIESSGPIPQAARAIGTIATICGVAAPWSIQLFLRLLVLVGPYTFA